MPALTADFDPLSEHFLADPYAVMRDLPEAPVFSAPALGYHVVTRFADIEHVFLHPEDFSAQLPLVALVPEAGAILLAGGHQPQPSMVSLDPPAHGRLRRPAARAFTPRRVEAMRPASSDAAELRDRPSEAAGVSAALQDADQLGGANGPGRE